MIVFLDGVIVIYLIEGPDAFRSKSWPERGRGREQVRRGAVSVTPAGWITTRSPWTGAQKKP
jgi:hypothetical protein